MKHLIVYDLDGTLVDTKADIAQSVNHMLTKMRLPKLSTQEVCRLVGRGLGQLIAGCLQTDNPKQLERGMALYRAHYAAHALDQSVLYPGAQELLEYFKSRKQGVITNKPDPFTRDILAGLGIERYFFKVMAGDGEYPKKPDATALEAMMDQALVTAQDTVLIGDSPIDVETGRHAGVMTVGLTQGFGDDQALAASKPDLLARDCSELLAYAKRWEW